jgi:acid phosphatase type 7
MDRIPNKSRWWLVAPILVALIVLVGRYGLMDAGPKSPAVTLTRGPYLQAVTPADVTVVWETATPGDSRVDYGPTAAYGSTLSDSTPIAHHALTLTGLSPYTTTHYRVSTDGQPMESDSTFQTAATPTQTTFSFVAFGDTRTGDDAHRQVVSSILSLAPNFVLHTGDFVADGNDSAQWTEFFSIEHDLLRQSPLYGALGNHEGNSQLYFDAFHFPGNERWYSFDYGNVHFVALEIDGHADYSSGSPQVQWLKNDLAHTSQQWKVVFFHIPPYSSGSEHGSNLGVRAVMEPLFRQYGVDLVFNGHDHDYERSVANGITYIVTGGGGAPLYAKGQPEPASVYFTSTYHSVQVSVTGMTLAVTGVRPDGVRFDEFTLDKRRPRQYLPVVVKGLP